MHSEPSARERQRSWHRWVWINFHLAVWIFIAYALAISLEQHLDWLDHDGSFGRRGQAKEAFISMILVLGQLVGWVQRYRVGDAPARKLAAALSLIFLGFLAVVYGIPGSHPERALSPQELWLIGYIVASHLAFAATGPPAASLRRPEHEHPAVSS
jgi:hypothetical protein